MGVLEYVGVAVLCPHEAGRPYKEVSGMTAERLGQGYGPGGAA